MAVIDPGILAGAAHGLPMPNATAALSDSYALTGQRIKTEEMARQQQNNVNDQTLLSTYLKDGGSLNSSEDFDKLLTSPVGQQLSPDGYLMLKDRQKSIQKADLDYKVKLQDMNNDALKTHATQLDTVAGMMGGAVAERDRAYAELTSKGFSPEDAEKFADDHFNAIKMEQIKSAAAINGPVGPAFNREALDGFMKMDYKTVRRQWEGSSRHVAEAKRQYDERLKQAEIERTEAQATKATEEAALAKARSEGKITTGKAGVDPMNKGRLTTFMGPDGKTKSLMVYPDGVREPSTSEDEYGSLVDVNALGLHEVKPGQSGPLSTEGKLASDMRTNQLDEETGRKALEKKTTTKAEQDAKPHHDEATYKDSAKRYMGGDFDVLNKMFGRGIASVGDKKEAMKWVHKLAEEKSITLEDMIANSKDLPAVTAELKDRQMWQGRFDQYSAQFLNVSTQLLEEAKKVDDRGVTVFNKWSRATDRFTGDTDVVRFNALVMAASREHARIATGITSNAALTVSAARTSDDILGHDMTLGQFEALVGENGVMRKETELARDSNMKVVDRLRYKIGHMWEGASPGSKTDVGVTLKDEPTRPPEVQAAKKEFEGISAMPDGPAKDKAKSEFEAKTAGMGGRNSVSVPTAPGDKQGATKLHTAEDVKAELDRIEARLADPNVSEKTKTQLGPVKQMLQKDLATKQSSAPKAPTLGEVRKGYKYIGGPPGSPSSWQKVQ